MKINNINCFNLHPNYSQKVNKKKSDNTKGPNFKSSYTELYNLYSKSNHSFAYKVPQNIFKKIDQFFASEQLVRQSLAKVTQWEKKFINNTRIEANGFTDNNLKAVRKGFIYDDYLGFPEGFADEYVAIFDENTNHIAEMEFLISSHPSGAEGICLRKDYYPQSNMVEYEIKSEPQKAPWRDFKISHYTPYGVLDRVYEIRDSQLGNSYVTVKDVFSNNTETFYNKNY